MTRTLMAAEDRETAKLTDERRKALNLAIAQIEKTCGKGAIMRMGSESPRVRVDAISTGAINLDAAIGVGGIPRGRVTEIFGPESSGKTTLALSVVANAQRTGGAAAYIDAEHALDIEYAKKLGVDIDNLLVSQPDTGEQGLHASTSLRPSMSRRTRRVKPKKSSARRKRVVRGCRARWKRKARAKVRAAARVGSRSRSRPPAATAPTPAASPSSSAS